MKERQRILVMRYRFIGDTLLTVPFLRNLRRAYPDARIDVLVGPNSGELLRDCPYIDELIFFDTTRKHRYENQGGKPRSFWSYVRLIKERKYDTAFVLKRSFSSAALAVLAGIPERIGFDTEHRGFLLTQRIPYHGKPVRHEAHAFLEVLEAAGVPVQDDYLESWWNKAEEQKALKLLSPGFEHVALHLTSSNQAKQWPESQYVKFAQWLFDKPGRHVHCLGAASDRALYDHLAASLSEWQRSRMQIHCGDLSLTESMALLHHMDWVVGVDSGTMHMAAAARQQSVEDGQAGAKVLKSGNMIPVITLFGPMNEARWAPVGGHVVTEPVECRPCDLKTPCRYDFQCMRQLSAEKVIEACRKL